MSKVLVTSHHAAEIVREIGKGDQLAEILHIGINRLGGLTRWVSSGTLLSLHRDGRFKSKDNDIDVGVLYDGTHRDLIESRMFPWAPYREVNHEGQLQQFAFVSSEGILFDINFYHRVGGELLTYTTNRVIRKPAALFEPVTMWKSPVGIVPAPNDLDAYCAMRYGKHWKTPSDGKGIYDGSA
jgi:hypothetical protein